MSEQQKTLLVIGVVAVVLLLLFFGGSAILGPFFGNPIHDSVFNPSRPAPPRVVSPPLTEEQRERMRERVRQHRERRGAG